MKIIHSILNINNGIPRCSMYGIFTYIRVIFRVNVGKYSMHGAAGYTIIQHYIPNSNAVCPHLPCRRTPSWSLGTVALLRQRTSKLGFSAREVDKG